jgi:hypothetical protein
MIKATQRIATQQYCYVELEMEYDSAQEAIADHTRLVKLYEDGEGLPAKEWAQARNQFLVTGEFDVNLYERMSKAQRFVINEMKLALRACKADDPVVE